MKIYRSNGTIVDEKKMISIIKEFINERSYYDYHCLVGTDSQTFPTGIKYVTSIVIHRVGNGAIAFHINHFDSGNYIVRKNKNNLTYLLSKKMFKEATFTLDYSVNFLEDLFLKYDLLLDMYVHFDISGESSEKTYQFKNAIIGMAKSYGFREENICIKPYALAAQSIANKKTKKLSRNTN